MTLDKRWRTAIYAAAALAVVVVIGVLVWFLTRPHYNLTAAYVNEEPVLDGKGGDSVWDKAEAVEIPVKDGPVIELKSVYTNDKVSFLARFKDSTKDDIDEPWTFDGKTWKRGRTSDQFALFFDIDQSITDFEKDGFEVMDFGFKPGDKLWHFGLKGKTVGNKAWEGAMQRADVMMMHSSISSPFGMGDDGYFGVLRQYLMNPTMTEPRIWTQWDSFSQTGMIQLNTNIWQEAIRASAGENAQTVKSEKPYLKYADPSDNLKNTPYPYDDQLVPIESGDAFKKGDMLPWVYFSKANEGHWGGSRDDIIGKMTYEKGYWTVEMGRKLDTGHDDDIKFVPNGKSEIENWFGPLVRTDGASIRYGAPARLIFGPKEGE